MKNRYLFKAKRIDNEEWVIGLISKMCNVLHITELDNEHIAYPINRETICQCTGMADRNGDLIWENDICDRNEMYPEIVKYREGDWTLDYSHAAKKDYGYNYYNLGFYVCERKNVEVIGNVFDNPELLEVEK